MKNLILITLVLLSLNLNAKNSEQLETKYSNQGYPYKMLIDRSDSIKILFTEKSESVRCAVRFNQGDIEQQTTYLDVNKTDFKKQPLVSCLPRFQAKAWLKRTFE
ncbi:MULTISPECIES: hypothetical protein [Alteromonadaceae]|uniref:hypothetical protein n=1 Tax=Alteromonadaceae TaxID=72275 RepID=UPI001C0A2369|nr:MULTISPECIES: hypothetical protein [Aliiglaciecola]MBU2877029.1 hypothetical protein [Aliiglaciecola lipolytica]MDO6712276.1 hypothetical protein [Aliiglaciecola sp. 2_MG-2023]MDO6753318.1 hypothetical protein [Aliiglaciecola sp. 1_MG-2023]